MVDRDVVLRKSEAIEHHGSRLRAKLPLEAARLRADETLRNDVCFDALQAIQACIDLAVHACSHDSLGVPDGPARAFALLGEHGVIPADLAARLSSAAGLRNLIVHQYTELDMAKLASAVQAGLGDLDAFAARLRLRAGLPVYEGASGPAPGIDPRSNRSMLDAADDV